MKASADIRAKWLKEERNEGREQAAIKIQQTTHNKLTSKHDETKAQLLLLTDMNIDDGGRSQAS
jgi:hypothetical protein